MNTLNLKNYSITDKKLLLNKINEYKNKRRDTKIFNLICKNNINYSNNDNGIFFDLNQLNDDILIKIENIILYYELKQKKNNDYSDSSEKHIF
jgi:hypothetical protein